jgi:oxygen-independent coproporphyrinogen III oxidase
VRGQRWANVKRPQRYIQGIEQGHGLGAARDEKTVEHIDDATARAEFMMLGLRLVREGVSAAVFAQRVGAALEATYADTIQRGVERGLLEWVPTGNDRRLRLTRQGRFLANEATIPFL